MASTRNSAPTHRRTVSSTSVKTHPSTRSHSHNGTLSADYTNSSPVPSTSSPNKTASRIITSMKRSFTNVAPKKRGPENQKFNSYGMISTPTERTPLSPPRFRHHDSSYMRPTVEQIAMGLHVSRTPHLRPPYSYSQRNLALGLQHPHPYEKSSRRSASPLILPPPPTRSSMKKPSTSNSSSAANPGLMPASTSSSTITSNTPPTPHSSNRSLTLIKLRMSRFLPGSRSSSAPSSLLSSPVSSPRGSTSDFQTPRKAVRFTAQNIVESKDE